MDDPLDNVYMLPRYCLVKHSIHLGSILQIPSGKGGDGSSRFKPIRLQLPVTKLKAFVDFVTHMYVLLWSLFHYLNSSLHIIP
jgi:hypothetical protein